MKNEINDEEETKRKGGMRTNPLHQRRKVAKLHQVVRERKHIKKKRSLHEDLAGREGGKGVGMVSWRELGQRCICE